MNFLIRMLGGALGPYVVGGLGALLALSMITAGVQGARLKHAKADLQVARAALVNPQTRLTWRTEAERDAAALAEQNATITAQGAESATKIAAAEKGRNDARAVAESYRRTVGGIRAYKPKGVTSCERSADVVGMIRGDLAR